MGDPDLTRAEARSLADLGDFDRAREALARALDESPNDAELHALMGWYTYKCRGIDAHERERLALHHVAVSFELSQDNAPAHYYQGRIFAEQGNGARARASFEAALKTLPDYRPAQEALGQIGVRATGASRPIDAAPATTSGARRPRQLRKTLLVVGGLSLVVAGVGFLQLTSGDRELSKLAKQLGTKLPLRSAAKSGSELHLDVGDSWAPLPAEEQQSEMQAISGGARGMGLEHVFVYGSGQKVAESHEGKICIGDACGAAPSVEIRPGGETQATDPAPAPESEKK